MAVLASEIITRVREILVDEGASQRWTDAELLRALSDGQRTIAAMFPDQATKVATVLLVEGTRQELPTDGESLITVYRNMGASGTLPGRAIRLIKREILDDQNPYWHAEGKTSLIYNYVYDPLDPQAYSVYPPANGVSYVQLNYSFNPPEVSALSTAISLSDIYLTPLTDFVLYKAHQKDSDFAAGQGRAAYHLQAFMLFLTGRDQMDEETNPNQSLGPFNPQISGAAR